MSMKSIFVSSIILLFVAPGYSQSSSDTVSSELREKYDGYGEDWIFMPDGNGQPQVAVLKGQTDLRGIFDEAPVTFRLYTRDGNKDGTNLTINDTKTLKECGFSASRPTKIITHGWKSSTTSPPFMNMKDAFLDHGEYNVICVDWASLAASTFYLGPMASTGKVGREAAKMIDFLVAEAGLKTEDVHFIGHSLGAHVAGNTGYHTKSGRIGRITGLDPALPGMHLIVSNNDRLDRSDAIFVDIIHSCGGVLGWFDPLGDVDFYPNGGTAIQPGCCCLLELLESCSHGRSHAYFTESINTKMGFPATKCSDWDNFIGKKCADSDIAYMGAHTDPSTNGTYFLKTRHEKPFAYVAEIVENDV